MVAFISVLLVGTIVVAISFKKSVTPNRSFFLDLSFSPLRGSNQTNRQNLPSVRGIAPSTLPTIPRKTPLDDIPTRNLSEGVAIANPVAANGPPSSLSL